MPSVNTGLGSFTDILSLIFCINCGECRLILNFEESALFSLLSCLGILPCSPFHCHCLCRLYKLTDVELFAWNSIANQWPSSATDYSHERPPLRNLLSDFVMQRIPFTTYLKLQHPSFHASLTHQCCESFSAEDQFLEDSPLDFVKATNFFIPSEWIFKTDFFHSTLTCLRCQQYI